MVSKIEPMKKILVSLIIFVFIIPLTIQAATPGDDKKAYFIHHSTGEIYRDGTTKKGGMKKAMKKAGYTLKAPWWDGDTDPQDFPELFNDSDYLDILTAYDIIIFKSCYPASGITSKSMLEDYKDYYRELYDVYEANPDILFVPMSTPPLPRLMTSISEARRAKKFDYWLSHEYADNYSGDNLAPYRLHKQLRNGRGYLRSRFVDDPYDGHPKAVSGVKVGKTLTRRLNNILDSF